MKILVTGANGQVGSELSSRAISRGWEVLAVDRDRLDITNSEAVKAMVEKFHPDAVVNAAAYTAVDKAESDADTAYAINRDGPANLAVACEEAGIPLVHYSTDYVFDGGKSSAYVEGDPVSPLGVYGASKLAGEQAVQEKCALHLVLRTSWVFSSHGRNFVKTMLRLGAEREELGVVVDQFGKPTSASEIAKITFDLLTLINHGTGHWGLYHLAQPEVMNWHGFSEEIFTEARRQGILLKVHRVNPISTADYPTPASRPTNSELNCERLESVFDVQIRSWQESLKEVIRELASE